MSGEITKREAKDIATKLEGVYRPGRRSHEFVTVFVSGVPAAFFRISHSPREKNRGIPAELGVSFRQAIQLARCDKPKTWYLERVRAKWAKEGFAPPPQPPTNAPTPRRSAGSARPKTARRQKGERSKRRRRK